MKPFDSQDLAQTLKRRFARAAEAATIAGRLDSEIARAESYNDGQAGHALYAAAALRHQVPRLRAHVLAAALMTQMDAGERAAVAMRTPRLRDLWQRMRTGVDGICLPTYKTDMRQVVLASEMASLAIAARKIATAKTYLPSDDFLPQVLRARNNRALLALQARPTALEKAYIREAQDFIALMEKTYPTIMGYMPAAAAPARPRL